MQYKEKEIKKGIKLHEIQTDKFKTNLIAVFLTMPITRENTTKNALISAVLRRGSKNMPTLAQISKEMEEMYGASFDCGIDKTGDNQILKFYMESINNNFLPENENLLKESIEVLFDLIFNPETKNNSFKDEYVNSEKENLKQIIQGKIDNKAKYAYERCVEEMYKGKPFGLYKFGNTEELEKINAKDLYEYYKKLIAECKIDIFISGEIDESIEKDVVNILKLNEREPVYNKKSEELEEGRNTQTIEEHKEVSQGKLVIGLQVGKKDKDSKYSAIIYNAILGGTPTSKMFQNVREKAHLAYVAGSNYVRQKNNVFIRCGIEIENYQKALDLIKVQIEDMKKGDFTEEDIKNAKTSIISTIKAIPEEQDSEITYNFGQEISGQKMKYEEYEQKINEVTKQNIIDIANSVKIDTIYFLG